MHQVRLVYKAVGKAVLFHVSLFYAQEPIDLRHAGERLGMSASKKHCTACISASLAD